MAILGIGGIFFKSKDSQKLCQWYEKYLGFSIEKEFNCSSLPTDKIPKKGYSVWSPFSSETFYFDPSKKEFMINFIVDDVQKTLDAAKKGGAIIIGNVEEESYGTFGWFLDPEDNKIELWKPNL